MKKISTLLMLFCAFVCSAWAGPTDLPEMSTDGSVKYYAIKSVRSNKYASYLDATGKLENVKDLSLNGLFYFTGEITETDKVHAATQLATVKIGNFVVGNNKMAGFTSWSAEGANWYISSNGTSGLYIGDKPNNKTDDGMQNEGLWGAWNDASNTITDYYFNDAGAYFVVEAKTLDDVKAIAKADLAKMAKLSALSTEGNYNSAVSSVDAATTFAEVQVAVATYINTFNNKNVRFSNNGNNNRTGLNLSVNAGGSGLMGNAEEKDNSVWTLLSNGDGTFKLYNFSRNVYAKADRGCNANVAQAGNFTLKVTGNDKTALIAKNEMVHQAEQWSPNYDIMSWWDYNDDASIWTVEACDPTAITRADYDAALAAKATLPWSIQQAYGLVKSGDNIKVVVNHPSGSDCQPSSNLLDGLTSSFVHSSYDSGTMNTVDKHYIQANLGEGGVDQFYVYMTPRNANNRPKEIVVSGSNTEDGEYTQIATITTTLASSEAYMSEKLGTADTKYQYIRLTVNSTNTGSKFFTLSECYFLPATGDAEALISAYHNFATVSVLSNEITTAATTLINGEATLALANTKKEIAALLDAAEGKVAEPGVDPALGQYTYEAYHALDAILQSTSATQETLDLAISTFKKSKNVPVYIIKSAWDGGYPKGSAIFYNGSEWRWKAPATIYNRDMWMTIPDYTQENVPVVESYNAANTSYEICDYTTGKVMRDKKVQIVKVPNWDGVFSLQYNADGNSTDAAHHAQSGGKLVNWKVAQANDCQASGWIVQFIGTSYELDQLTDEYFEQALPVVTELVNVSVPAFSFAEGVNNYNPATKPALDAAVAKRSEVLSTFYNTVEDLTAAKNAAKTQLEEAIAGVQLNMPVAGNFYRLRCTGNGMKYLQYTQNTNANRFDMISGDAGKTVNATFCYTDGGLVSYVKPMYINHDSNVASFKMYKTIVTFSEATNVTGQYFVNVGGRYLFGDGNNSDSGDGTPDNRAGYRWWLEEVTELPISITAAGYATFYAPCNITLPDGLTAYTVTVNNDGWATLNAIEGKVIPANTGVVLGAANGEKATEGNYTLNIGGEATAVEGNELRGTVAASYVPAAAYVLGNINVAEEGQPEKMEVGFYTAKMTDGQWLNNGFKAYLPKDQDAPQGTLRFNFGGNTTAIESVLNGVDANAPIYDLSGRRVVNAVKGGIYIQNGKKFIVK